MKASNVVVSEGGEEYEPGGATGLGSYDRPGTFGAEQLEITEPDGGPTRGFRVVWHYDADSEERVFQVDYDITGVVDAYDDVIYVPWAVWGSQWQFNLDDLHAEIALAGIGRGAGGRVVAAARAWSGARDRPGVGVGGRRAAAGRRGGVR